MSNEEKILLIKLILEDIRGNWGWENGNRGAEAYELSRELYKSTNDEKWDKLSECIARYEHGEDGRYFRDDFPNGYLGMESLYSITETYKDKSDEFKEKAKEYLTYPEYRFKDFIEEQYIMKEKTADEMFEELGYKKKEQKNEYGTHIWYYQKNGANEEFGIEFAKSKFEEKGEIYCVCHSERDEAIYINIPELQAINKKCQELGWIK